MAINCNKYACTSNDVGVCSHLTPGIKLTIPSGACSTFADRATKVVSTNLETDVETHPLVVIAMAVPDVGAYVNKIAGTDYEEYIFDNLRVRVKLSDPANALMSMRFKGKLKKLTTAEFLAELALATDLDNFVCWHSNTATEFTTETDIPMDLLADGVWYQVVATDEWFDLPIIP